MAAELAIERAAWACAVASRKCPSWIAVAGCAGSSELAKWLITTISACTFGSARSCASRASVRVGSKPSRCMPVSSLSQTRSGRGSRSCGQQRQLVLVVHDDVEVEPAHFQQVAGFVDAGQHDDAVADAGGAQALAVGDGGDAEGVRTDQRARHALEPVAVAVGLDHGHHPTVRRQCAHPRQIVLQRAEVDRRECRSTHSKLPAKPAEAWFSNLV